MYRLCTLLAASFLVAILTFTSATAQTGAIAGTVQDASGAVLPEADGDAIGGTVNLVTKTPTERPTLDFEGLGGYVKIIGGRWLDAFNGTVGTTF
jgi:hypothetical protein